MPIAKKDDKRKIVIKPLHIKEAEELYFPSIITEFIDSWTPRWSSTNIYGRMDPISFYNGTGRELTLGFRVIADDKVEAKQNMTKIEKLIQYQYPLYRKSPGIPIIKAPPYFEIDFMNIVGTGATKLQGYINGAVQINPGFQSKTQAQYFSEGFDEIYFSDINIVLRMQVMHEEFVGFISKEFNKEANSVYPYGIKNDTRPLPVADIPPSPGVASTTQNAIAGTGTNTDEEKVNKDHQRRATSKKKQQTRNSTPDRDALLQPAIQRGGIFDIFDIAKTTQKISQVKKKKR